MQLYLLNCLEDIILNVYGLLWTPLELHEKSMLVSFINECTWQLSFWTVCRTREKWVSLFFFHNSGILCSCYAIVLWIWREFSTFYIQTLFIADCQAVKSFQFWHKVLKPLLSSVINRGRQLLLLPYCAFKRNHYQFLTKALL